jgi:acetyl-CoA synthetase
MHDSNILEDQPIAWTPTPDVIERAQLMRFMRQIGVSTWDELYEFSIRDVEKFTEEVLKFLDIKFDPPYDKLLDTSDGMEFPRWFVSEPPASAGGQFTGESSTNWPPAHAGGSDYAGLNITTMCLDRWQTDEMKDQPAVIWEGENGRNSTVTYASLLEDVERLATNLRDIGIEKGDPVGIHLPMIPETVDTLLAINRIGAIAVPVFSGYGVEAIANRLNAVQAKLLVTFDGVTRRGKYIHAFDTALDAIDRCPSVKYHMLVRHSDTETRHRRFDEYREFGLLSTIPPNGAAEPTSAEDPLIILYTSGTTGKPKGIAHTHASFPIKAAQDMAFGTDVGRGTRICWYTDIGWMMGPWLIYGALINGATICLYDGAPDYPTPDRMWEFCAKHKVEILGISPTLVRSLAAQEEPGTQASRLHERETRTNARATDAPDADGSTPVPGVGGGTPAFPAPHERHDLSSLRAFASTGEPWNPAPWRWLFEKVGNSKLPIINYSGGTEIAGGILMGNPLLPIKPCSFPAPCPGMDVDILDENGNSVKPGEVGELVIKQPWIGMARGFWKERERYLETYWSRFKNIWVHGDWAMRDEDGHWFILGRSDDTLKVAGKRVGPAEVESILVSHPFVTEAAVIGVPDEAKGTAMVAFCVLGTHASPRASSPTGDETNSVSPENDAGGTPAFPAKGDLAFELKFLVARDMGKPLAPSKIYFVSALPKTRNAKVMRRVLRSAYLGEDPGDLSALENPQAIDEIRQIRID